MSTVRLRPGLLVGLRQRAGLSQMQVAAQLDGLRRQQSVGDWERGRQQPAPRMIPALAVVLGVSPLELLDVDVHDPPLQALRLAAGLSLLELEAASGVSYSRCRRLEGGQIRDDLDEASTAALADALKVDTATAGRAVDRSRDT